MSKNYITNSKFKKTRLYDLMTLHMIHKNCFKIKNVVYHDKNCKIDIIDIVDETLANVFEMKDVKCNNIYLNMLKLKIDFRKIRKHLAT